MLRKKSIKGQVSIPSLLFLMNNVNELDYDIMTKLTIADNLRALYLQHYNVELLFEVGNNKIVLADTEQDLNSPLSIRFINDFRKQILNLENQIRSNKQNKYLSAYIGKLASGKIVSIGGNRSCVVNILNVNMAIDINRFLKGDVMAIDKEYLFLIKEVDDCIVAIRNDKDYIKAALGQYLTSYDVQNIKKIYRHPGYLNYVVIDTPEEHITHYVQRYLSNIEFINEDLGYEKIKFFGNDRSYEHLYLDVLHVSKTFRKKHLLCGIYCDNYYIITDKLNIWRDTKLFDLLVDEIYNTDKITVSVLHLRHDKQEIRDVLCRIWNIPESVIENLFNIFDQVSSLHQINVSKLIELGCLRDQACRVMNFIVNFYLYDYSREIDINKYIINNDCSIMQCLNKTNS